MLWTSHFNRFYEEEKGALMSTEITHPEENPQLKFQKAHDHTWTITK